MGIEWFEMDNGWVGETFSGEFLIIQHFDGQCEWVYSSSYAEYTDLFESAFTFDTPEEARQHATQAWIALSTQTQPSRN